MATTRLNKVANKLVSDLFIKKEFDENAETIDEIAAKSGISRAQASKTVLGMLKIGKIEKVWKRGSKFPIPAYRIK
jgi:DNA-binding transcriptional regulator GbsR (MarR family)